MSSRFSTTMQRLLESIGAAKATQDPLFQSHLNNLQTMGELAERLTKHVDHCISALVLSVRSAHKLAEDFKECFEKLDMQYTVPVIKYEVEMLNLRDNKCATLEKHVADKIGSKLRLWLEFLYELQKLVSLREECRVRYDHYLRKISSIRQVYEALLAKGEVENPVDKERRQRNEKKFEQSKHFFEKANGVASQGLNAAWSQRFLWINVIMLETIKTQIFFSDTVARSHASVSPYLKVSAGNMPNLRSVDDPVLIFTSYKLKRDEFEKEKASYTKTEDDGFLSFLGFKHSEMELRAPPEVIDREMDLYLSSMPADPPQASLAPAMLVPITLLKNSNYSVAVPHVTQSDPACFQTGKLEDDEPGHDVDENLDEKKEVLAAVKDPKKKKNKLNKLKSIKDEKMEPASSSLNGNVMIAVDEEVPYEKSIKPSKKVPAVEEAEKNVKLVNADAPNSLPKDDEPGLAPSFGDWDFEPQSLVRATEQIKPAKSSNAASTALESDKLPKSTGMKSANPFDNFILQMEEPADPKAVRLAKKAVAPQIKHPVQHATSNPFDFDLS